MTNPAHRKRLLLGLLGVVLLFLFGGAVIWLQLYLVESILEPNRTIAPSYETLQVQLQDGRVLNGVRIAETLDALTVGDTKGDKHVIARKNIDVVRPLTLSTMPDGLEQPLSADDFVDLIAFLASQK